MQSFIKYFFLSFLASIHLIAMADVDFSDKHLHEGGVYKSAIIITGEIKPADFSRLNTIVNSLNKYGANEFDIVLNSNGGNVDAALKMGRLIRKSEKVVLVPSNGVCASSCVFLLASGVAKFVDGRVLIHRPYQDKDANTSSSAQKASYKKLRTTIENYLDEMNIPLSLFDDMMGISSSDSKELSKDELKKYRLLGVDPFHEEAVSAKEAKKYGISKSELYQRRSLIDEKCFPILNDAWLKKKEGASKEVLAGLLSQYTTCSDRIMSSN